MATETRYPQNTVVSSANLTGISVNATNGLITATVTSNNLDTQLRLEFPTPSGNPVGTQTLRAVWDKFESAQSGTATAYVAAYDGATLLTTGTTVNITGAGIQGSVSFDASLLVDPTGAGVRIEIYSTRSGGGPAVRCVGDPISAAWDVNYSLPTTPVGQNVEVRWDSRQTITSDLDTRWDVLNPVSADSDTRWDVQGGTTPISNDLTAPWFVAAPADEASLTDSSSGTAEYGTAHTALSVTPAGTNRFGIVKIAYFSNANITQVLWGATDITVNVIKAAAHDGASRKRMAWFYIIDPPATPAVVTWTTDVVADAHYIIECWQNVAQVTPYTGLTFTPDDLDSGLHPLTLTATSLAGKVINAAGFNWTNNAGANTAWTFGIEQAQIEAFFCDTGGGFNTAFLASSWAYSDGSVQFLWDTDAGDSIRSCAYAITLNSSAALQPVSSDLTARWAVILGFIQSYNLKDGDNAATIASAPMAVTAGNTLIVGTNCAFADGPVTSVTDTAGNTYSKCGPTDSGGTGHSAEMWVATDIIGHAANVVTVTFDYGVSNRGINVVEYVGLAKTNVYDAAAPGGQTNSGQGSLDHITAATALTDTPNELILGSFVTWNAQDTFAGADGCVVLDGPGPQNIYMVERVVSAVGTYTINATGGSTSQVMAYCVRSFRAAAQETLDDTGLLVRYYVDEAASGTGTPAQLLDSSGNAYHLDLYYDAGKWQWAEDGSGNRYLSSSTPEGVHRAVHAIDNASDLIRDALTNTQTATLEFVVDVQAVTANNSRIGLLINGRAGNNPTIGLANNSGAGTNWRTYWNEIEGDAGTLSLPTGRVVIHVVYDTTLASQRAKVYVNGVQQWGNSTNIGQFAQLPFPADRDLTVGNRESVGSWARQFTGGFYYGALYTAAFDATRAAAHAAILLADDDAPAAGTTPVGANTDLRWDSLEAVSADSNAQWNVLNPVSADGDLRWNVLNPVSADSDLRWGISPLGYDFRDPGDIIYSDGVPVTPAAPFTVSCWFSPSVNTALERRLVVLDIDASNHWNLMLGTNDLPSWRARQGGGNSTATGTTVVDQVGAWYHLVGVEAASNSRFIYVNGAEEGSNTGARSPGTATSVGIGNRASAESLSEGIVAHVAIWNGVLSQPEIAQLAAGADPQSITPVSGATLVSYWPLIDNLDTAVGAFTLTNSGGELVPISDPVTGITTVSADSDLQWDVIEAVSADSTAQWDVLNSVGANSDLRWGVLNLVNADRTIIWDLQGQVASDLDLSWDSLSLVAGDSELQWSLINSVFADSNIQWSVLEGVLAQIEARWSLITSVGSSSDIRWDVQAALAPVGANVEFRYNIAGNATNVDLTVEFNTPPGTAIGNQTFEVLVRRDSAGAGAGTPTVDISLYQDGAFIATLATGLSVTSDVGEILTGSWDASLLNNASGRGVQCRVQGTIGDTRSIDIGAVSWASQFEGTASVMSANVGGNWKETTVWVNNLGVWKQATPAANASSSWH